MSCAVGHHHRTQPSLLLASPEIHAVNRLQSISHLRKGSRVKDTAGECSSTGRSSQPGSTRDGGGQDEMGFKTAGPEGYSHR